MKQSLILTLSSGLVTCVVGIAVTSEHHGGERTRQLYMKPSVTIVDHAHINLITYRL